MQELVYQKGIGYFNYNIEILRDIEEVVGSSNMANAYGSISWAITDSGRIDIMIVNRSYRNNTEFHGVVVEFEGDGVCCIYKCDQYGKPIDEKNYTLFDTHAYRSKDSSNNAFKNILKTKYDVCY